VYKNNRQRLWCNYSKQLCNGKQMNKNIIWIIAILSLVQVSAVDYRFYAQQDENITIINHCYDSGANCISTIPCNITITREPYFALNNKRMTNNGFYLNYTFYNTSINGEYQASIVCKNGADSSFDNFFFKITASGNPPLTTGETILYGICFIFFLSISISFLVWSIGIDGKNTYKIGDYAQINYGKYLKLFLFTLSYFGFWIFCLFAATLIENYFEMSFMYNFFMTIFQIMSILIIPFLMVMSVAAFVDWIADAKLHKLIKRGLPPR